MFCFGHLLTGDLRSLLGPLLLTNVRGSQRFDVLWGHLLGCIHEFEPTRRNKLHLDEVVVGTVLIQVANAAHVTHSRTTHNAHGLVKVKLVHQDGLHHAVFIAWCRVPSCIVNAANVLQLMHHGLHATTNRALRICWISR